MSVDRYSGFVFDAAALAEDVDLDVPRRKAILHVEAHLGRWSHWELLGIPWNAPADAARAAYVAKVRVFHPDRYPSQRLGSYRARVERIFHALTEARDTLADERRREDYARRTAPAEDFARLEARRLEDERRAEERRARLARQNPIVARASRVGELVRRGRDALEQGRCAQAANDLALAAGLDPANAGVRALADDARRRAAAQRAADAFERGLAAEARGNDSAALAAFREAFEATPGHVRAAAHGARAALGIGDLAAARELAQAAVRAGPRVGAAHEALGLVLVAERDKAGARRELERALELDPDLALARERLRRLRWSILA